MMFKYSMSLVYSGLSISTFILILTSSMNEGINNCTNTVTHYHHYILFNYHQNTKSYFIYSKHSQEFFDCLVMFFEYYWYFKLIIEIFTIIGFDGSD